MIVPSIDGFVLTIFMVCNAAGECPDQMSQKFPGTLRTRDECISTGETLQQLPAKYPVPSYRCDPASKYR